MITAYISLQNNLHLQCIYYLSNVVQMFIKYGTCDINTTVHIKDSFTIAEMFYMHYLFE